MDGRRTSTAPVNVYARVNVLVVVLIVLNVAIFVAKGG